VVGAVILPTLAVIGLLLVPFIDRGEMRLVRHRTSAIGLVLLAAAGHAVKRVSVSFFQPGRPILNERQRRRAGLLGCRH
jgi:hypothetical protein